MDLGSILEPLKLEKSDPGQGFTDIMPAVRSRIVAHHEDPAVGNSEAQGTGLAEVPGSSLKDLSRERIEALAARLNIDADTIREINRIPKGMRLKAGSTVVVPRSEDHNQDISATLAESATMAMEPDVPDARRVVVRAGRRDTVATLAHRYGVSAGQVQSWNKLSGTKLVAGQSLVLMVPARSAARSRGTCSRRRRWSRCSSASRSTATTRRRAARTTPS